MLFSGLAFCLQSPTVRVNEEQEKVPVQAIRRVLQQDWTCTSEGGKEKKTPRPQNESNAHILKQKAMTCFSVKHLNIKLGKGLT